MTQQINLLEPSLRPTRQWGRGRHLLLAGGALAAAVLLHHQFERLALARVLAASGPAPGEEPIAAVDAELQERQASVQRDEALLKTVAGLIDLPRDSAQRLRVLIAALPPHAWLKEVEFRGARGVRITGGALDALSVAEFSRRLGQDPAFKGLPVQVFALEASEAEAGTEATADRLPSVQNFVFSSPDTPAKESR